MKTFRFICISILAALLGQSCVSEPQNHHLSILYPNGKIYYADHEEDSVVFLTFDSWKVRSMQSDWLTITTNDSYNFNYSNDVFYRFSVLTKLKPNTTNHTRLGELMVTSYEYTTSALYPQVGFLNITRPAHKVERMHDLLIPDSVSFTLTDSADVQFDSICFNVSGNWKLDFAEDADRSWLMLDATEGVAGKKCVVLNLQPNVATEPRETRLVLTCKGVENEIVVRQQAAKKED